MNSITMYMHGGSENHGCEAIVRSTIDMLGYPAILYSRLPTADLLYGIGDVCQVKNRGKYLKRFSSAWFVRQIRKRVFRDDLAFISNNYCNIIDEADKNSLYLSIGGDNYCGELVPALQYTNDQLNKKGIDTILWGCSIDPEFIENEKNRDDLLKYTRIFAREKTTYQALMQNGFEDTSRYYPDPAFTLKQEKWELPEIFSYSKVVGINISPYVQKSGSRDIVFDSYKRLIEFILKETDFAIALIPHVVWNESDDRIPLKQLYDLYKCNRVVYIGDRNCMQLKYCIAHCDMLIAARTHASIAGYSSCIPTLVVGYSMKSNAIAKDIFGDTGEFVVNAPEMKIGDELIKAFEWQCNHKEEITDQLNHFMPGYIEQAKLAGSEIKQLMSKRESKM